MGLKWLLENLKEAIITLLFDTNLCGRMILVFHGPDKDDFIYDECISEMRAVYEAFSCTY